MITVSSRHHDNKKANIFWKMLLAAGLFAFLIYGLSFFLTKPTTETITTHSPQFNANRQPMQTVKFQTNNQKR